MSRGTSREEWRAEQERRRRRAVDVTIRDRGLRVEPFGRAGAWRISGLGVDILFADWSAITAAELAQ